MSSAKIGVSMLYRLGDSFNRMVKRLGTENTRCIEILDDGAHELSKTRVSLLREVAKSYDLEFTVHAPFADINIASPSRTILEVALKRLEKSLYYAHALDAMLWVLHPGAKTGISQFYPDAGWKQNVESIEELYAKAEHLGVNVAIENLPAKYWFLMSSPEDFCRFYRETSLPIGIVLDVGHAHLESQVQPFFDQLADKIVHIHVSDNHGVNDDHLGVGYGTVDYDWFAKTLKKVDYNQRIIVESCTHVPESLQKLMLMLNPEQSAFDAN
ncbi:MAG: sugar phosphate isomerase/epimerase [Nitrososphaerota archaeon]|jgi:sugar phosphate isomerase/epimerase|nr:sugar phosphate isomerase/epimerase [Nitrososphaerota archaeon]